MRQFAWTLMVLSLTVHSLAADDKPSAPDGDAVLATVGPDPITEADFQLFCAIHNIPADKQPPIRAKLLDQLVEQQLIRRFLARQKIAAEPQLLAGQVAQIETLIRARKDDPEALLKRLGLTKKTLEAQLALPLAWEAYVRRAVTDPQIEEHFQQHRAELDGTKLRASQIILKLPKNPPAADVAANKAKLAAIRKDILAGKLTFAAAAGKFSEAPSKAKGGDVEWFSIRGPMPSSFCEAAFGLKVGEISDPVVSPFGVHLIQVTDQQPGQLTLEDVRAEIIKRLAQELWTKSAEAEREKSKVVLNGK